MFDATDIDGLIRGDEEFGIGIKSSENTRENSGIDSEVGFTDSIGEGHILTIELPELLIEKTQGKIA